MENNIFKLHNLPGADVETEMNALLTGLAAIYPELFTAVAVVKDKSKVAFLVAPLMPAEQRQRFFNSGQETDLPGITEALQDNTPFIITDLAEAAHGGRYGWLTPVFAASWTFPILHSDNRIIGLFSVF